MVNRGIADQLPGYKHCPPTACFRQGPCSSAGPASASFAGLFQPQGFPQLCRAALAKAPDASEDAILTAAYERLTSGLAAQLAALRNAGAEVLLVDLAGNGGGSEWAEAAVRMVTARPLHAAKIEVVPSDAWRESQRALAVTLRKAAATSSDPQLPALAAEAQRRAMPCQTNCRRLVPHGFATGLVDGALVRPGLPPEVDSTAQYGAARGIWTGPVLVLVDDATWSAAEEFAATLQDHDAAVIIGTRTGGAGCGHATERGPVVLAHSKATLRLPDCVRYRRDGSNEVRGVIPDVPVAMRQNDAPLFKAKLIAAALPVAIAAARSRSLRH